MELSTAQQPEPQRSIDVTGLPEEAIQAVELLVAHLRGQQPPIWYGGTTRFSSYEAWSKALREWMENHLRRDTLADDSRETIYADEREE